MNLTREQAKRLYTVFQDHSLRELERLNILDIVLALRREKTEERWGIFFEQMEGQAVEGIKLIRTMLGCSLREAKDLYDEHNPERKAGRFGPFLALKTREQATEIAENLVESFERNAIRFTKVFIEEC